MNLQGLSLLSLMIFCLLLPGIAKSLDRREEDLRRRAEGYFNAIKHLREIKDEQEAVRFLKSYIEEGSSMSSGLSFKSGIPPQLVKCPDCRGKLKLLEEVAQRP